MKEKERFSFKNKFLYYNKIKFNNWSERDVEIPIAFDFLANLTKKDRILEVGNVLSYYENSLSEYLGIRPRRIVDKFEVDLGVDNVDLMALPSDEKYDAIVSISTVEHIGQGVAPSDAYGEQVIVRDLEAPLKAITKIYQLLFKNGKAFITVPFGKLIDGEWYIQFDQEYLKLLETKYRVPPEAVSIQYMKKLVLESAGECRPYQVWLEETESDQLVDIEYNWPWPHANAIAIIELTKVTDKFSLVLGNNSSSLVYQDPKIDQKTTVNTYSTFKTKKTLVVIDGVFFQLYQTGIARLWRTLLEEWAANGFAQHTVVLDRAGTVPKIPGIRYRTVASYDYNSTDADSEMLQQVCDEEGADIFISTYYTTPITTPSVFMAYDMIPELLGWDLNNPMWREKHHAIAQASAYMAISENTARDLIKCFPDISPESITVAPCGVKSTFSPTNVAEVNTFKNKYGISKPYFMVVGMGGYKNTILFLQAFAQLHSSHGFDLVCTGSSGLVADEWRAYTSGSVVYMLQLSDEELRAAYSGAVALVYPSKYEGFGLPVLEAMACGSPVITCPNASIPEVAGEAALYVNDDDIDGMVNALCEVQKPAVRHSLIAAGLEQAKKFSWSKMANTVSSVLVDATLLSLNLKDINLVIFPDWSQSEELLGTELEQIIRAIATHPNKNNITLLVDTSGISDEDANLLLSGAAMNLLMQEDLDVSEGVEISLVGTLGEIQWDALLPHLHGRISLEQENQEAIAQAHVDNLPTYELDKFSQQPEQFFFT
ncbi:MAG: glycosyltransferase [Kastovskya adunca ATA6-11-RM4]|jgi:glycosyltransferase involved in cell wall biosynthesis|nr:glycosyltransferase [Kastovskya adunca ATA6-11-RM4]